MLQLLLVLANSALVYELSVDKKKLDISGSGEIKSADFHSKVVVTQITTIKIDEGTTKICSNSFDGFTALTSISLPKSCSVYENNVFKSCTSLQSIEFPEGGETFGNCLFSGCTALKTIIFPSTTSSIDTYLFLESCNSLQSVTFRQTERSCAYSHSDNERIIIKDGTIGLKAGGSAPLEIPSQITELSSKFIDTSSISQITFSSEGTLKKIGDNAFRLTSIADFNLPEGLESIGSTPFIGSAKISYVYLPSTLTSIKTLFSENMPKKVTVGANCAAVYIDSNNVIMDKDKKQIIYIPYESNVIEIPSTIEKIDTALIQSYPYLANFSVHPDNEAYSSYKNLMYGNDKTECLSCPGGLLVAYIAVECKTIAKNAFQRTSVKEVYFEGQNVTKFLFGAFQRCYSLVHIELPSKLTELGDWSFYSSSCANLKLVFPSTFTTLGGNSFNACGLKEVDFSSCTQFKSFSGSCFVNSGIEVITLPPNLESIGSSAFQGTKIKKLEIPSTLKSLGSQAFYAISQLTEVIFKDPKKTEPLLEISARCFMNSGIQSIEIPDRVSYIRQNAFASCGSLQSVTFSEDSQLTTIEGLAFANSKKITSLTFGSKLAKLEATALAQMLGLLSIDAVNNPTFSSVDGALYKDDGKELVAFPGGLSSFVIKGDIERIGDSAFYGCENLINLEFQNVNLKTIGENTFYGCSKLISLNIPSVTTDIEVNAFYGCSSLSNITIGAGSQLGRIGAGCFDACKLLESVKFEGSATLKDIEDRAFQNCLALKYFDFPSSLETIGERAFAGCQSLMSANLPMGTLSIGASAFEGCTQLTMTHIPTNITAIGTDAFRKCSKLSAVYYCGSKVLTETAFTETNAVIIVRTDFPASTFCGLGVKKTLDLDCMVPTSAFTAAESARNIGLMASVVIESDDN